MFQKILICANLFLLAFVILSFSNKKNNFKIDSPETVPVGTIIYSVIEPNIFLKNFKSWRLLSGDTLDTQSTLKKYVNFKKLPDVRGYFIRSANIYGIGVDPELSRKEFNSQNFMTAPPRNDFNLVIEGDLNHLHANHLFHGEFEPTSPHPKSVFDKTVLSYNAYLDLLSRINQRKPGNFPKINSSEFAELSLPLIKFDSQKGGDVETRPINISFYTYIKIN